MIGTTIKHYRILEKLGEGGMGVVYKARDSKLERTVVLKFLPTHVTSSEEDKQRFIHEAKAAAALDHNNICTIFSIEETDEGNLFIVMSFYNGVTLEQRIRQGQIPLKDVVTYSLQIAAGIFKAHENGIVHRDLKPANILITNDGQVKIIDFGLAKAAKRSVLTKPGTTPGTVQYMSPEQAKGGIVDRRTDIWSLGVIMYEMVSGKHPFKSEYETALVYSILNEDPEPVTGLRSGVPMDLEMIINKCIEKDPEGRYQHSDEIIVDLRRVDKVLSYAELNSRKLKPGMNSSSPSSTAVNIEHISYGVGTLKQNASPAKKSNGLIFSVLLVIIAFMGLYMYYSYSYTESHPSGAPKQTSLSQITFAAGVDEYPAWSPDGSMLAFSREVDGYQNIYIKNLDTGHERQVTSTNADNIQPVWSPDGESILFVRANQPHSKINLSDIYGWHSDGSVWELNLDTMTERKFIDNAFNPSFSLDGEWIAVDASWAGPRRLWIVDKRGRNPRQISSDISEAVVHTSPKWSPDGLEIVFQHIEGTKRDIRIIDRRTEEIAWVTDDHFINIEPYWSQTGDAIYFSSYRGGGMNIWRVRVGSESASNERYEQITMGAGLDRNVSISPDGARIAFTVFGINSDIWMLPVSPQSGMPEGNPRPLIETTREDSRGTWSPDGKTIAFNSDRTGDMNIWLYSIGDRAYRQLTRGPGGDYQPNWSPDGKWITFFSSRSGSLDIWAVEVVSGTLKQYTNRPASDINPFYSPDGNYIAFHSDENGRNEPWIIRIDGNEVKRLAPVPANIHFMRWTPDAQHVIFRSPNISQPGLWLASLSGEEQAFLINPMGGAHISFSPDFSRILDVVNHQTLWVTPLDGTEPYPVFEFDDPEIRIDYPVWSPDGRSVLFDRLRPSGGDIWLMEGLKW